MLVDGRIRWPVTILQRIRIHNNAYFWVQHLLKKTEKWFKRFSVQLSPLLWLQLYRNLGSDADPHPGPERDPCFVITIRSNFYISSSFFQIFFYICKRELSLLQLAAGNWFQILLFFITSVCHIRIQKRQINAVPRRSGSGPEIPVTAHCGEKNIRYRYYLISYAIKLV